MTQLVGNRKALAEQVPCSSQGDRRPIGIGEPSDDCVDVVVGPIHTMEVSLGFQERLYIYGWRQVEAFHQQVGNTPSRDGSSRA